MTEKPAGAKIEAAAADFEGGGMPEEGEMGGMPEMPEGV